MRFKNSPGSSDKDFERPDVGGHLAALVRVDDVGYQEKSYLGEKKVRPKSVLTWELDASDSKGRPFTLHSVVPQTLSGGSNPLPKIIEALLRRPLTDKEMEEGVEDSALLGKVAYLVVAPGKDDDTKRYINRVDPVQGSATMTARGDYTEEPRFVAYMRKQAVRPGTGESVASSPAPF